MEVILENADVQPIYVEYQNDVVLIHPGQCNSFTFCDQFNFRLRHFKSDTNNVMMYMASAFISYEQSRIELTVDGEYIFEPQEDKLVLKIKSYEYMFDRNVSYNTFVFNCNPKNIRCVEYFVPNKHSILRKCRYLYLFGDTKTFFPICIILFLASLLCVLFEIKPFENILFMIGSGIATIVLGVSYFRSLRLIRESLNDNKIRAFMDSQRIEYRKLEDRIVQSYLDNNINNDKYW